MSGLGAKALGKTRELEDKKANKKQMDWIEPTLLNGWIASKTAGNLNVSYMKDELGFVHFRGSVSGGDVSSIFSLPVGYRPEQTTLFSVNSDYGGSRMQRLRISTRGTVYDVKPETQIFLDGITFKAKEE